VTNEDLYGEILDLWYVVEPLEKRVKELEEKLEARPSDDTPTPSNKEEDE